MHFLFPGGWDISSLDSFNKSGEIDDFYIAIAVENNVSEFDLNTYSKIQASYFACFHRITMQALTYSSITYCMWITS